MRSTLSHHDPGFSPERRAVGTKAEMNTWQQSSAKNLGATEGAGDGARRLSVLRFGVGMMLGFAAGYLVWSALLAAFPETAIQLLGALFHGVDFRKLDLNGSASLSVFGVGAALWAVKGFVFGVVYAAIYNALSRRRVR